MHAGGRHLGFLSIGALGEARNVQLAALEFAFQSTGTSDLVPWEPYA